MYISANLFLILHLNLTSLWQWRFQTFQVHIKRSTCNLCQLAEVNPFFTLSASTFCLFVWQGEGIRKSLLCKNIYVNSWSRKPLFLLNDGSSPFTFQSILIQGMRTVFAHHRCSASAFRLLTKARRKMPGGWNTFKLG